MAVDVRPEDSTEWVRYWRWADRPVEAMHARFRRHAYHPHSHETYSFGLTERGAQAFSCRGGGHTSAAGMVMAFNPDDPHDGRSASEPGFVYRILHVGPELVSDVLADTAGWTDRRPGLPLFAEPVLDDPRLASTVDRLHRALISSDSALRRDELLGAAVRALVLHGARGAGRLPTVDARTGAEAARVAAAVRRVLDDRPAEDLSAAQLAAAVGASRYGVYRAFRAAYGLAPSDYQRQVRLRTARRLLVAGTPLADAAVASGFADQAHLTRWFKRYYGLTPAAYRGSVVG